MAKIKMEEIMEGLAHGVWEEKCNIHKFCSRQTKGGFISYHLLGIVITSQVVHAMQQPLCHDRSGTGTENCKLMYQSHWQYQ